MIVSPELIAELEEILHHEHQRITKKSNQNIGWQEEDDSKLSNADTSKGKCNKRSNGENKIIEGQKHTPEDLHIY